MAVRAPTPSVLVIVCILAAVVSPALVGGASAASEPIPAAQSTPGSDGGDRAGAGNPTARAPPPQETATRTPTTGVPPRDVPETPSGPATPAANETGPVTRPAGPPGESSNDGGGFLGGLLGGLGQWFAGLVNALANPLQTFQGYAQKFLELLVNRPIPTRNGDPAWFARPDGAVMGAVYDVTWTHTLPIAIVLVALSAGLATGMRGLVPPSVVPNRQATGAIWTSIGTAFHVMLGWPIMVGWAVVVHGVATWLVPSGDVVLPGGESVLEQVVAGGFGGYLLWASSGVLAVLVVIVWALSWLGALLAPPAYPLLVAANPPDLPVLRRFRLLPDEGILIAMVAMPVPTAFVLGVGYPIINALRTATTGPIATMAGIGIIPFLTLVMWFVALVAPLVMLWPARNMRPVAAFAAGALGAASAISVHNRLDDLRDSIPNPDDVGGGTSTDYGAGTGGGGTTVDPLEGSPFERSSDGGFGGALGGDGGSGAAALGAGPGAGQGASGGAGGAMTPSPGGSSTAGPSTPGSTSIGERSQTVGSLDEIPDGQRYEIGFETSDGEWQPVKDNTYPREFLFEGDDAFSRIDDAVNADTLYARGVQDAETYDIQNGLDDH